MARNTFVRPAPPVLTIPREDARGRIAARLKCGEELAATKLDSSSDFEQWQREVNKFNDYNHELLRRVFSSDEFSRRYRNEGILIAHGRLTPQGEVLERQKSLRSKLDLLTTVLESLDLIEEPKSGDDSAGARPAAPADMRSVFVVHGHDDEAKVSVARFLERGGLRPVVLHEQEDRGRTIIEKFEAHADVQFAVVLLTPDDEGKERSSAGGPRPRARQNVVLELGYFLGRLGRHHVCALRKAEVELPSDLSGVLYVSMDNEDGWKIRLGKELRAAGYPFDLNHAL